MVTRHPETTFVCVHFANNAEELDWVDRALDAHPNMMADLAARVPEIGRHDPTSVRRVFEKHQDRILFATDFQVYDTLTLGSGGSGPPPTDADALIFFEKHWRWLETRDKDFAHMTPIQGNWTISAIGLRPRPSSARSTSRTRGSSSLVSSRDDATPRLLRRMRRSLCSRLSLRSRRRAPSAPASRTRRSSPRRGSPIPAT